MRGFSKGPGLVVGEACRVRVLRELPKGTEIIGKDPPDELFDSLLDGSVTAVGDKRPEGGWFARARLLDTSLQSNPHPLLRPYLDKEPGPHVYEVIPRQYLNGWTREEGLKPGQECFIWIRPEGNIPWLEREPNQLPSAFPFYPHAHLVGFWRARVTAIVKPRGESPVRKLRAVFDDPRIRLHPVASVRDLHGHEPWTDYSVTLTDHDLLEAGGEAFGDLSRQVGKFVRKLELPEWLKRASGGGNLFEADEFDP